MAIDVVEHRNLALIEVSESEILDELMLDKQIATSVLMRLSDQLAVVDPSRFESVVARMRKLGHLPRVEE